jgi:hypothetical protein
MYPNLYLCGPAASLLRVSVHYGSSPVIVLVADERSLVSEVTKESRIHSAAGEEPTEADAPGRQQRPS